MRRNSLALPLVSLLLAAIGGLFLALDFGLQSQSHTASSPSSTSAAATGSPAIDGRIEEGEYAHRYRDEATGIELHWTVLGEEIFLGLRGQMDGWVALSLSPSGPLMQGGDIIIGYVSAGELNIRDNYADGPTTHKADVELGGSDDILEAAGSEDDRGTTIEFQRKLDTKDRYDRPIAAGEVNIQLAYSDKDDFLSYHLKRATIKLNLLGE